VYSNSERERDNNRHEGARGTKLKQNRSNSREGYNLAAEVVEVDGVVRVEWSRRRERIKRRGS